MSTTEPEDDLPRVIPEVIYRDGEPMIAREMVVKPSPIPRSLSIIIVLLAAASFGITIWGQAQRNADNKKQNEINSEQDRKQTEAIDANKKLILALLNAKTPEERRKLLENFANNEADREGSPRPSPIPQPMPTVTVIIVPQSSPQRTPAPRSSPTRKPSPKASASKSPSPAPSCVTPTQVGPVSLPCPRKVKSNGP